MSALSDIKVLDLMWVMAGPAATRTLADYGATVVRVESTRRIDTARTISPYQGGQPNAENAGLFFNMNANKLMTTIDLAKPSGREVILDLVRWADVVTEAFSPKAMSAWGLDYESLRKVKPDIIMLSTCLMGQSGPLARFAGFGNLAAAFSGFFNITGWPDRPASGPFSAYTDYVSPRFTAAALLAALDHRRRTGEGQYIDQSQMESALHFLGPAILDYTANGRVQTRAGNRDPSMSPHGVFPAAGEDRWIAIAASTQEQWEALCGAIGQRGLSTDPRFATKSARLANQDELDAIVAGWTSQRPAEVAEATLQAASVPASMVQNSTQMYRDPQMAHRGHFVSVEHPEHGTTTVEGTRFILSRTPARDETKAPTFGRDNEHVLESVLGYSEERIVELVVEGVLE